MSFDGFSEIEIQKITKGKTRKPDGETFAIILRSLIQFIVFFSVKTAKNIPTHTKVKQVVLANDENQNRVFEKPVNELNETVLKLKAEEVPPALIAVPVAKCEPPEIDINGDKLQRLHDFELHRRLMEEQNKMKRNLLQQAISKYAEKTQAETKKLEEIKHALDLLDSELATDVSILRKEIEYATLHFNNVEKSYIATEKSFLKAKQDLYQAHEKKELLTEHLQTIIQYNEDRKAKKLTELMEKVGLSLDENGT